MAVAAELKRTHPEVNLVYIGQKGDSLGDIPANDPSIDKVYVVNAGKFRRYHGEGFKQLLDLPTIYKNIKDAVNVFIGVYQSRKLIKKIKPSIVFSRGGYVSVPVSIGAKLNKVPYITHDSDSIPSLANRLIAPWAIAHFVALPKELYPYPQDKTFTTGIPLSDKFVLVNDDNKKKYREKIDINQNSKMMLIIGGGLGAKSLNNAVIEIMPNLMAEFKDLQITHIVGRGNDQSVKEDYRKVMSTEHLNRIKIIDYTTKVYLYSGSADLIITRAGATSLADFAVQGKACIIVPSSFLTGGHQLKNAKVLSDAKAAIVVRDTEVEENPNKLAAEISRVLKDPQLMTSLSSEFAKFGKPNSTRDIAERIMVLVENKK